MTLPPVVMLIVIGESCYKYHFCRDKHVFVATKHVFCRNRSMLVVKKLLSQQTYFCHDKTFVATNICHDKHFVATKVLLRQAYFCCNKHMFVTTKHNFCHNKSMLVASVVLS